MNNWPRHYLTYVHRDVTGKELVPHKSGIWYGLADEHQEHEQH